VGIKEGKRPGVGSGWLQETMTAEGAKEGCIGTVPGVLFSPGKYWRYWRYSRQLACLAPTTRQEGYQDMGRVVWRSLGGSIITAIHVYTPRAM
jgi:hypothetical protein